MFLTPEHLAIVMEHLPEGDLFQYLQQRRSLPESEARWCFQQLVLAIDYSHRVVSSQAEPAGQPGKAVLRCPAGGAATSTPACSRWPGPPSSASQTQAQGRLRPARARLPLRPAGRAQGVANRDIKLENALLARRSPPVLKLCDFGYSKARGPAPTPVR